jgi:hypothetical protein
VVMLLDLIERSAVYLFLIEMLVDTWVFPALATPLTSSPPGRARLYLILTNRS